MQGLCWYRVTFRVRRSAVLFTDFAAGRAVVLCLREMDALGLTRTGCFVLMPDGLDWLFALRGGSTLAGLLCRVRSATSERVQGLRWYRQVDVRQYGEGHDLRSVARHMVAQPVQLGLVASVADYALWDACWLE
jgi:hypothetical protein